MDVNVADQSKPGAIDLLYSNETKGVEAANGKTIALKFVRKMSKLTLNMTKDETIESFEGLKVEMKGIATEGKFDLANGTVKATDGKNTQAVAMNIGNVEAHTAMATAIILPTAAATDQTKMDLTFTLAGKTFTHSIADLTAFEAGKNVTFGVKLSVNNGKPVVTVGNATIKDWAEVPGGDFDVNFGGEGGGTQPGEEKVLFQETFGKPEKNGKYWPYLTDYTGFDNPATMFENVSTEKASVRANEGLGNVWFPAGKEVAIAIKGINVQGATTATLECEVGANVYKAGESQDLNTLKVVCNQKELVFPSKIVSGDNKEGNKPFKLVIENVSISEDARLEFSGSAATNTYGLRLFSVKLYVPGEGGGTVDPTPEPEPEPEPQPQPTPSGTELYISEYVEGGSFNKYIELYNPTEQDIDLSQYTLGMHNYSKDAAGGNDNGIKTQVLSGTLKSKQVIVYKHTDAVAYTGKVVDLGTDVMNFNGNDPIILYKGEEIIDFLGVDNAQFGKDVTLRRKADAAAPSATYDESQWEKAGKDDVTGLGQR